MSKAIVDIEAQKLNDSLVSKHDSEKLNQIICKAELLLGNLGFVVDSRDIIFDVIEKGEFGKIDPNFSNAIGLTCQVSIEGKKHRIWLLENMTYIRLLSVVAHEMGHTWCRDNKLKFPLMLEEGFCELLAYHVLSTQFSKLGNVWKDIMLRDPDPIYGDGLRYMLDQFEKNHKSWFKFRAMLRLKGK